MQKIRVGVLRGGTSPEYDVSLKTGKTALSSLSHDKYETKDIFVDKEGLWHIGGFPVKMEKVSREVDVVFNALHGEYGEDGKVQQELESFSVPYTGSRIIPSAISMNKGLAKHCFDFHGIKTPRGITIKRGDDVHVVLLPFFREISGRHVVKPLSGGSSFGVVLTNGFEELYAAVENILNKHRAAIVEEYIKGREVTCAVIDGLNSDVSFALPLLEIVTPGHEEILSYDSRYFGKATCISPANIEQERVKKIQQIAKEAHKQIGLSHYSTADFIVSPRGIYLLEMNSLPGFSEFSAMPKILEAGGFGVDEFLDYVITCALKRG